MTIDDAVDILWQSAQQGVHYPPALHGQLTLDQAYRVQLGVLARAVAGGDKQAGWKIGLSAEAVRRVDLQTSRGKSSAVAVARP